MAASNSQRPADLYSGAQVITVDSNGEQTGTEGLVTAHTGSGVLHSAFSVQLVDQNGLWLLQRRLDAKPTFGGRWANSCCSHPKPGETPNEGAVRRVGEELGIQVPALQAVGSFVYRAIDPATGYVEHEYDHVFVGTVAQGIPVTLDPAQIAETRWVTNDDAHAVAEDPQAAPWFAQVFQLVAVHLAR